LFFLRKSPLDISVFIDGMFGGFLFLYTGKRDKTIKGLTKHGVAKVNKTNDGLFVEIALCEIAHLNLIQNLI